MLIAKAHTLIVTQARKDVFEHKFVVVKGFCKQFIYFLCLKEDPTYSIHWVIICTKVIIVVKIQNFLTLKS